MAPLRYPQYDLDQSLEVARAIAERGSGATVSSHELAKLLGYSGTNNGAYLNRVAAARLYGLIEGRADAIGVTGRAEDILHPDYPQTADRARLDAFREVPLYGAFLDAFRGRELPDNQGMINALIGRFKVSGKEAKAVLPRMLTTAEQAGLFRIAGSRTRLIEPSFGAPLQSSVSDDASDPGPTVQPAARDLPMRQFPKIIDGALELMPSGPPWSEAEYMEWLDFFDKACRVYYRIAREGPKPRE